MIIVIIIAIVAIILFTTEYFSADLTAFLVMVSLMISGIITPEEGLSGFSNMATITVFALLVLSLGLQSTGVVNYLGERLEQVTGTSELRIMLLTVIVVGFLSAFMNNTAIVAIFLPIITRLSEYAKVSPSKFLMPLSFAAMIGGSATIIGTSTNILAAAIYEQKMKESIGIFEFFYLGLIFFIAFVLFMLFIGKYIIPERKQVDSLTQNYNLQQYLTQIIIKKDSPMIGQKLEDTELMKRYYRVRLIALVREGEEDLWLPSQVEAIQEGDMLIIKADLKDLLEIQGKQGIKVSQDNLDDTELNSEETVLFEAVIGRSSFLVGKRIKDVNFRHLLGALPLAIRKSGFSLARQVWEETVEFGDVLLLQARRKNLTQFYNSQDFIVLGKVKKKNFRRHRMLLSSIIVLGVIVVAALNLMPIVTAALAGAALLFVTGCMSMRYAYRKMDWRVIFLLAGILPLGIAVQKTGVDSLIAQQIIEFTGNASPRLVISMLFLITTLLTSFMSNNATAVLLTPIALMIASELHLDPKPFVLTVMFAASTSFLTPIGYQTNTLVYGAGQYTFMDFVKVGGLLTLLVWGLATLLIPWMYF